MCRSGCATACAAILTGEQSEADGELSKSELQCAQDVLDNHRAQPRQSRRTVPYSKCAVVHEQATERLLNTAASGTQQPSGFDSNHQILTAEGWKPFDAQLQKQADQFINVQPALSR